MSLERTELVVGEKRSPFLTWIAQGIMIFLALLFLMPILLIFVTGFKADAEIVRFTGILPHAPTLANFERVLQTPEEFPVFRWLLNSIFISSSVTLLVLTVDSLAAYGLARLNLPGKKWVFGLIVGTLMVPGQILLVPVYLILNRLGWLDTPLALIVPAGAGAFGVFLLHQFFVGIPRELEEAAALDGCSRLKIYWHVVLPLSRPALATLGLFTFIGSWNDFIGPLVFLDSSEKYTLPVGVAIFQSSFYTEYGLTLAASVLCTLPILIVFLLFQRNIVKGIAMTGLKD
ncbi:MAG: carbohydrate ABC transporter permease [Chthonomonadaceae bacterium]|nr:carbohydrate ABC transporter permease [Chthonomonadaceae bacterium]